MWVFYNKFIRKMYVPVEHGMVQNEKLGDFYKSSGARGDVVVKALHYKLAGGGFDSRWCHWNFSVT